MDFQEIVLWIFFGWYFEIQEVSYVLILEAALELWDKILEIILAFRFMWGFMPNKRKEFIIRAFKEGMYVQEKLYVNPGAEKTKCVFRR
jgi:hypothetical protein